MRQHASFGGNSISYLRCGEGYPTVLLHNLNGCAADWTRVLPVLGEHLSVYAPDLPGRGESFSIEESDHAALVARFLEYLGIAQAALVVAPECTAVARDLADRFPRRVSQVLVADPAGDIWPVLTRLVRCQPLRSDW